MIRYEVMILSFRPGALLIFVATSIFGWTPISSAAHLVKCESLFGDTTGTRDLVNPERLAPLDAVVIRGKENSYTVVKRLVDKGVWIDGYFGISEGPCDIVAAKGNHYFAKTVRDDFAFREVAWVKILATLKVGPKYIDFIPREDERHTIVTEFIDGTGIKFRDFDVRLGQNILEEAYKIGRKLIATGIAPNDLQFRLSKSGALFVIDPALFSRISSDIARRHALGILTGDYDRARVRLSEQQAKLYR